MGQGNVIHLLIEGFSTLGVVVFAISGALFAAEKRMDILGFILIGTVTALGGGTTRDLLLGLSPVSWVANPGNVYLAIGTSALTYFTVRLYRKRMDWILWMDALGLAAFAVLGTEAALAHQVAPLVAVVLGVMSATFGGIIRDVLCAEVLTLMQPELYISCALLGASVYVALDFFSVPVNITAAIAFLAALGLRAAAIVYGLKLPNFQQS